MKNILFLAVLGASALMTVSTAYGDVVLVSTPSFTAPVGTTEVFAAIGTYNNGNQKARLEANGQTTVQGGNPGNGWYGGTPRPVRSWEVDWNNSTGSVTFLVYASSDWTGTAAMTMTQTPVLDAGKSLVALDIGARLAVNPSSVKLDNFGFDGNGSGFVSGPSSMTYDDPPTIWEHNYFELQGTGDFKLRGTAQFLTGTTTGDSMRFFVNGREGVPSVPDGGTTLALLGGALVGIAALRRKFGV
jgi:hypothetical protein